VSNHDSRSPPELQSRERFARSVATKVAAAADGSLIVESEIRIASSMSSASSSPVVTSRRRRVHGVKL